MSAFFQLWGREMASYFRTSIAYVVGAFFLAIAGVSFWILATLGPSHAPRKFGS